MRRLALLILFASWTTPAVADDAICPDRPLKGTASCTVPAGHFQLELDALDWTHDHSDGITSDQLVIASPTIKYGLGASTDIEATVVPFMRQVTRNGAAREAVSGVGDTQLRLKQRLTPADAKVGIALVPWVKLPTARAALGNGKWEEGLILPIDVSLPGKIQFNLSPEVDRLANAAGSGFHAQYSAAAALTLPFGGKWSVGGELWAADDRDPAGVSHQASADAALTFAPVKSTQFDAEVDVGLNHQTPALELIVGYSRRF